jgi:predicted Kef-type K+ transport protein
LLGLFAVNGMHNLIHLATGIVALIVGFASDSASKIFFQIFGVIYALAALYLGVMMKPESPVPTR